ncbi:unnamed protein product [Rotaria sordida]|uniref:Uncharacterized protein n=1 Tax=Rotaria sordida TaxID=392033 RepID=A0A815S9K1_9BILA|nr:unnamed protein product [Rotaria sordida]CAF1487228.1 unnamed protein product [Rotaria sordida]
MGSARRSCVGCKKYFCKEHLNEHEQQLAIKFDNEIVRSHDQILNEIQKLEESNNLSVALFAQVEQWKQTTINKVEEAAERACHELTKLIDKQRIAIKKQLEPITKEIRSHREDENYFEDDLDRLQTKLNEIQRSIEQFVQKDTTKTVIVDNDQIDWNRIIYIREEQEDSEYFELHVWTKRNSPTNQSYILGWIKPEE